MPTLAEVQRAFRRALHEEHDDVLLPFVSGAGRPAPARIETYRSMYWARQVEALEADFPTVQRLVTKALFERIAATHVRRSPSTSPSLAWLGRGLDVTLESLGLLVEAEVARLEWARHEAFWSPDAPRLGLAPLTALGDALPDTRFCLHPSFRLIEVASGVCDTVDGALTTIARERRQHVAVWRATNDRVLHLEVGAIEARALGAAAAGAAFGVACEAFDTVEDPSRAATSALLRWVGEGWLTRLV